jgi:hypothetical protein
MSGFQSWIELPRSASNWTRRWRGWLADTPAKITRHAR